MVEDRRLWKGQAIAGRILVASASIAMEAARLESRAFAVVADEAERLALTLLELVAAARFSDLSEADFRGRAGLEAERLDLLAVNSSLEALKSPNGKGVAICAEGIRTAAMEFMEAIGREAAPGFGQPPCAAEPSRASLATTWLLSLEVGGLRLVEGIEFVREVLRFDPAASRPDPGSFDLRGRVLPLVDPRPRLGLVPASGGDGRRLAMVNTDWSGMGGREFAIIVDGFGANAFARSRFGVVSRPRNLPDRLIRECWEAEDGGQLLFADWRGFVD
jgi:hypothetical protein